MQNVPDSMICKKPFLKFSLTVLNTEHILVTETLAEKQPNSIKHDSFHTFLKLQRTYIALFK